MMHYTHLAFGLLVSLLALHTLQISHIFLFTLIILFFSVFPDIDDAKSKIGRKNKLLSKIINLIFGHRGIFHSIYIPLIMFLIFYYNVNNEIGIAILLGYFSHLFIDALTKSGIRPLYPLTNARVNGFFKTNSFFEKMFFLLLVLLDFFLLSNYI